MAKWSLQHELRSVDLRGELGRKGMGSAHRHIICPPHSPMLPSKARLAGALLKRLHLGVLKDLFDTPIPSALRAVHGDLCPCCFCCLRLERRWGGAEGDASEMVLGSRLCVCMVEVVPGGMRRPQSDPLAFHIA